MSPHINNGVDMVDEYRAFVHASSAGCASPEFLLIYHSTNQLAGSAVGFLLREHHVSEFEYQVHWGEWCSGRRCWALIRATAA
jgi:hypothetical protein